jgi:hypothetical protein
MVRPPNATSRRHPLCIAATTSEEEVMRVICQPCSKHAHEKDCPPPLVGASANKCADRACRRIGILGRISTSVAVDPNRALTSPIRRLAIPRVAT